MDESRTASAASQIESLVAAERAALIAGESTARWWRRLGAAADATLTAQSLDSLLREALVTISHALGADSVSLLLANDTQDELIARMSIGLAEEVSPTLRIASGQGMAGRVAAERQPLIVDSLSTIELASPLLRASGICSVVAVPMVSGERLLGVVHAGSRRAARFDQSSVEVLELLAERLVAAMDRVRLFESERAARRDAELLADRLDRMQRVTSRLARAASVADVGAVVADAIGGGGGHPARFSAVWLVDGAKLRPVTNDPELVTTDVIPLDSSSPVAESARRETLLVLSGSDVTDRLQAEIAAGDLGDSAAVVPMVGQRQALGVFVVSYDSASERQAEEGFLLTVADQAAQALERARLSTEQQQLVAMVSFLADAAKVMAEAPTLHETLDRLAVLALPALGDICLIDLVGDDGNVTRMVARHRDPGMQTLVDRLRQDYPPDPFGEHPSVAVSRSGTTKWSPTMTDEFMRRTTRGPDHLALTRALGFRSYITVPLVGAGEIAGSVTFVSTSRSFAPPDVAFAEGLARQVSVVVHNARQYEVAARTSHTLQASLLPPSLPRVDGIRVHSRYLAATRGLEVGGDFYDVVTLPSGRVGITIGDVEGHGRDAAAVMGQLRSAVRALAGQVDDPPALVSALQWSWELLGFDRIATGIFGELDPRNGDLCLVSAGHYPPLVADAAGARYLPVEPTTPLGAPQLAPVPWRGTLRRGQTLLLYTDGVINQKDAGPEASMERLLAVVAGNSLDPVSVCERVVTMLDDDRPDDVAMLAVRLGP